MKYCGAAAISLWLGCGGLFAPMGIAVAQSGPADGNALLWRPAALGGGSKNANQPEHHGDDDWYRSNFEIRRGWIGTAWRRANAGFTDDHLALRLMPATDGSTEKDFLGAEVQTQGTHGFGRYEVVMRPARAHGVISSFFTYTGAHFDAPHDEIDIEFLGRDTTRMWAMAFSDGHKLPGTFLELGFDAADAPHLYAFDWAADSIVWFVDGREVFRLRTQAPQQVPQTPGKIYMNIWAGGPGQRDWSGVAPADTQTEAQYYCVSFQPAGADTAQCSDSDRDG